jgi:hypothetical protein
VSDGLLRRRLEAIEVPDAAGARERAWDAVAGEFSAAQRRPAGRRSAGRRVRAPIAVLAIVVTLFAAAVAASATQPGAAVRSFVVRVLGAERPPAPRAKIGPLPRGRMLVTSPRGAWIVARDGSRQLLGRYAGATWSPRGLYIAAWSGVELQAVAPDGRVAWTLRTPGRVTAAAWSPDGFRVAYRRAGGLGVVAGDGTAPRVLAASVAPAGPAWRPTAPHTLAWVDERGRIVVRDVDSGVVVYRSAPSVGASARELQWSRDGRLLLVRRAGSLRLVDVPSGRVRDLRLSPGERAVATAWAPKGTGSPSWCAGPRSRSRRCSSLRRRRRSPSHRSSRRPARSGRRRGRRTAGACWCAGRRRTSGCCCRRAGAAPRGRSRSGALRRGSGERRSCAAGAADSRDQTRFTFGMYVMPNVSLDRAPKR